MENGQWICKPFSSLSLDELYEIFRLRINVFVVEQNCAFPDADNKDQQAWHMQFYQEGSLAAYSRIFPADIVYPQASIGRIVTASQFRKMNLGRTLVNKSIDKLYELFGKQDILIGAQLYLKKFYESFGFSALGNIYVEDGIDHIHMLLPADKQS